MKDSITQSKLLKLIVIPVCWLLVWQLVAMAVDNSILIVGPVDTVIRLAGLAGENVFWREIMGSFVRIAIGFTIGLASGCILAVVSYRYRAIEAFLSVPVNVLKSVPVASFVVLFLIWWSSDRLSMTICACIVFPQMYVSVLEGLKSTDVELLEMAKIYRISAFNKFLYVYRPALVPFVTSAMKMSAGMAWKSGVAAEVIGTPKDSIGAGLYMSKIYLDTSGVLARTFVIIVLSVLCEKVLLLLVRWLGTIIVLPKKSKVGREKPTLSNTGCNSNTRCEALQLRALSTKYGDRHVFSDIDLMLNTGEVYMLSQPSGSGKTTLLNVLARLKDVSGGKVVALTKQGKDVTTAYSVSYMFQNNRLCEDFSALVNVAIVCGDTVLSRSILTKLIDESLIDKPVRELSGGEKRRVALARAYSLDSDVVLLDEPFVGLDSSKISDAVRFIENRKNDRITVIASHIETSIDCNKVSLVL